MIREQWYVVLESKEIGKEPVAAVRMGEKLVFWRDSLGTVHCHRDRCVHRGVALSAGEVVGDRIRCPFHGLEYDARGRCRLIPANGRSETVPERFRVQGYPAHEDHGFIWIFWGAETAGRPRFFTDLEEDFSYASVRDPWPIHYSRVIENQLDVAHLPFVHATTIGRGGRTLVDGPVVRRLDDDAFQVYVFNRRDDGSPPRKPEEISIDPLPEFHLEFLFPNLWQNHLSRDARVVAAFVPVDEENTLLYLRFYQRFIRLPLLRGLFCRLAMPFNLTIAHQDRRVVSTQRPKRSDLRIGEQLFQADGPILAYRRRRRELMEAADR